MNYLEIDNRMEVFREITLRDILLKIKPFAQNYSWSIQMIEGMGDVANIVGMSMMQLEQYCDKSNQGYLIEFDLLVELATSCDDIIEILVTGCCHQNHMPKAFQDDDWEKKCNIIISRADSSLWQLYSTEKSLMCLFESVVS